MKNRELIRSLNSVGKACFVKYFQSFLDCQRGFLKEQDLIDQLVLKEGYEQSGSIIRVKFAKCIIAAGGAINALRIVATAVRVPKQTSDMASRLIATHTAN